MNIWHEISDKRITPEEFIAVIEIPKGSRKKYEIDKETGMIILDRILKTSMVYPANYGFIPHTLSEDGDPLDVLVISNEILDPHVLVKCKPIGVIEMIDNGERDEKIIAVIDGDPNYAISDIDGLPKHIDVELGHFLRSYKALEKDNAVEVKPLKNKASAIKIITEAKTLYTQKFAKKGEK